MSEQPVEVDPVVVDCWPVDVTGCGAGAVTRWESLTPEARDFAARLAVATLRRLSGYRVGGCPVLARPCRRSCGEATWRTYPLTGGVGVGPYIEGGRWYNAVCGSCAGDSCACSSVCEVTLPGATVIDAVYLNGVTLDPSAYRLDSGGRLVRTDGDCWPRCQNLAASVTVDGTFGVSYYEAARPGPLASQVAGRLASEFAAACSGNDCGLPSAVTSITRAGVSVEVVSGAFTDGTGIREVDAWVHSVNPHRHTSSPAVFSLDAPRVRHQGGPNPVSPPSGGPVDGGTPDSPGAGVLDGGAP